MPRVVLAGRRINDGMGRWLAEQLVLELAGGARRWWTPKCWCWGSTGRAPGSAKRKVVDLICGLLSYGMELEVVNPWVDPAEAQREYGTNVFANIPAEGRYGAVVAAVATGSLPRSLLGVAAAADAWRRTARFEGNRAAAAWGAAAVGLLQISRRNSGQGLVSDELRSVWSNGKPASLATSLLTWPTVGLLHHPFRLPLLCQAWLTTLLPAEESVVLVARRTHHIWCLTPPILGV